MRDFNFSIAARQGVIYCCNHAFNIRPKRRPLRSANNHDGNSSAFEVLLVAHVFVRGYKNLEPRFFSDVQQFTIFERVPALLRGCPDIVTFKKRPDGYGRGLIERTRISDAQARAYRGCGQRIR